MYYYFSTSSSHSLLLTSSSMSLYVPLFTIKQFVSILRHMDTGFITIVNDIIFTEDIGRHAAATGLRMRAEAQ